MAADARNKTSADRIATHAAAEQVHVEQIAERITALGGQPEFSPTGLKSDAIVDGSNVRTFVDLVKEDVLTECIAMDTYRDVIG